jgi:hypothetical protein
MLFRVSFGCCKAAANELNNAIISLRWWWKYASFANDDNGGSHSDAQLLFRIYDYAG